MALDWKWLFIYPEQGIAMVNEVAAPVDVPIHFKITASAVMNSFFVPALAGQIYAMPGMQTQLHAVINKPGDYEGFSANYSGAGFSGMRFKFRGLSPRRVPERWVQWPSTRSGAAHGSSTGDEAILAAARSPASASTDAAARLGTVVHGVSRIRPRLLRAALCIAEN